MASRIFVTGAIRSGTTFVGRALSTSKNSIYIHEPFSPDSPWSAAISTPIKNFYIGNHNQGVYNHRMTGLLDLTPRIPGKWQEQVRLDRQNYIKDALPVGVDPEQMNVIVKDPIGIFCTEWLVNSFKLKPVIVVRDPRDVIKSIFRLSWQKNLFNNWIKIQPELHFRLLEMEEILGMKGNVTIEKKDGDLLNVISFLKPIYLALLHFTKISGYHMVCYERLTENSAIEFNRLFQSVGMVMDKQFEKSLNKNNNNFDQGKAHQDTTGPVNAERIRSLHQAEEMNVQVDERIIVDAFEELKSGFENKVDWWV